MIARAKTKAAPEPEPEVMENMNVRIPSSYREWLERRAARVPGFKLSDVVRLILKAEKEREEVREGRK